MHPPWHQLRASRSIGAGSHQFRWSNSETRAGASRIQVTCQISSCTTATDAPERSRYRAGTESLLPQDCTNRLKMLPWMANQDMLDQTPRCAKSGGSPELVIAQPVDDASGGEAICV